LKELTFGDQMIEYIVFHTLAYGVGFAIGAVAGIIERIV